MNHALHQPVLLEEVLDACQQMQRLPQSYVDGTFGRGGHLNSVLQMFGHIKAAAVDLDQQAIDFGHQHFSNWVERGQLVFCQGNFKDIDDLFESRLTNFFDSDCVDLILLDLGVSSPQFDQPERGFSFYHGGPLDMRMDQGQNLSAYGVVNRYSENQLIEVFRTKGEIRRPIKVARAIVQDRKKKPFESTNELAELIVRIEGWRTRGHHPATRYFQALRLEVNSELEGLAESLEALILRLSDQGRLIVISFHSLEDRIVKHQFRAAKDLGRPVHKKVIQAKRSEVLKNPRARSAKLRVFERSKGSGN